MSSLFLNGLYTYGINAISSANNLLLGGTNTNNIQILNPIIGDNSNNLTFSSLNTTDIVNTITQNFCFNSIVPSASINVTNNSNTKNTTITLDTSNITLDVSNITVRGSICPNYTYSYNGPNYTGDIYPIGYVTDQPTYMGSGNVSSTSKRVSNGLTLTPGVWYIEWVGSFTLNGGAVYDYLFTYISTTTNWAFPNKHLMVEFFGGSQANTILAYHKGSAMLCVTEKTIYNMYQEGNIRSGSVQVRDDPYYFRATRIA
jgi:hypothetical protein